MSEALVKSDKIESLLVQGDLSKLSVDERLTYYRGVCESLGLNPLTQPFEYITLNGKLRLYAKRDATEQLRKIHGVSVSIVGRELVEGVYVVTARAMDKTGRTDESIGAVPLDGLKGENRANAMMKAETKAKRRVTLSVCGLGLLDETEVEQFGPRPTFQLSTPPPRAEQQGELPPPPPSSAPVIEGEVVESHPVVGAIREVFPSAGEPSEEERLSVRIDEAETEAQLMALKDAVYRIAPNPGHRLRKLATAKLAELRKRGAA